MRQRVASHLCILAAGASSDADENPAAFEEEPRKLETQKRHLVEEEFTLIGIRSWYLELLEFWNFDREKVPKGGLECMTIETKGFGSYFLIILSKKSVKKWQKMMKSVKF